MSGDLMKVRRLFRRLAAKGTVRACYEALSAGYVLHRVLTRDGFHCEVIAPSLIPRKLGDHRKTDRLDAVMLAKLYRSGHLTPTHVPNEEQEALRRLIRLRYSSQEQCKTTKRRICSILLTHGLTYRDGKSKWTKKHKAWLNTLRRDLTGLLQTALAAELEHLEYLEMKRNALDANINRFPSPRCLMAYFGLVPSEHSSGDRERRGPITKAGNKHVRRILIEAAWNNRHSASADLILNRRWQGQPAEIVAIALKAQHRLSRKFSRLSRRKHLHIAITTVARELCGFV